MTEFNERDLIAVMAMLGMIIRTPSDEWTDEYIVGSAYDLANLMMEERNATTSD